MTLMSWTNTARYSKVKLTKFRYERERTYQNLNSQKTDTHYSDVIMSAMASLITGVSIVCSNGCSGAYQRKHQSSVPLAFVRGIHRRPVHSPHKGPVTPKNVSIWWRHHDYLYLAMRVLFWVLLEKTAVIYCECNRLVYARTLCHGNIFRSTGPTICNHPDDEYR